MAFIRNSSLLIWQTHSQVRNGIWVASIEPYQPVSHYHDLLSNIIHHSPWLLLSGVKSLYQSSWFLFLFPDLYAQRIQRRTVGDTLSLGLQRVIRTGNRSLDVGIVSYKKICTNYPFFRENVAPITQILSCYRRKSAANTGNKTSQRQLRIYSGCSILHHKISIFLFYRPEKISNGSVGANSCSMHILISACAIRTFFTEAVHTGLV